MAPKVALQLYSVAAAFESDPQGTLERAAQAGFAGVEFAGYAGLSAGLMRGALERAGLRAAAAHVPYRRLCENLEEEAAYANEAGIPCIVCPIVQQGPFTAAQVGEAAKRLGEVAERLARHGIAFCYHNHWQEAQTMEGLLVLELLRRESGTPRFLFEPDLFWLRMGRADAAGFLQRNAGLCPLVHVKDYTMAPAADPQPGAPGDWVRASLAALWPGMAVSQVPVGQGEGGYPQIIDSLARQGGTAWLVVEQEIFSGDPFGSVKRSCAAIHARLAAGRAGGEGA